MNESIKSGRDQFIERDYQHLFLAQGGDKLEPLGGLKLDSSLGLSRVGLGSQDVIVIDLHN